MVGSPPCRIWVLNFDVKFGEYCPVVIFCVCTLMGKGRSVGTWKHLELSSASARKYVIDGIDSSRTRRGQIAKCVKGLL